MSFVRSSRHRTTLPVPPAQYWDSGSEGEQDPLDRDEIDLFGRAADPEPLATPPSFRNSGYARARGGGEASTPGVAPLSRAAKRPRAIKLSPAKDKRISSRVNQQTTDYFHRAPNGEPESFVLNREYCESCGEKGEFLCCDGCPRSYHFSCLDPPITVDDVGDLESWYCNICRPRPVPPHLPRNRLFHHLIERTYKDVPRAFQLAPAIRSAFKDVATGPLGEYIDQAFVKAAKPKFFSRTIVLDSTDPFKLKDRNGKLAACYKCGLAASEPKGKRILGCDFCDQHWHLDCLDPPLIGLPPANRKWQCPLHTEHIAPRLRESRHVTNLPIHELNMANTGNVSIIPKYQPPRPELQTDELSYHGIRYQVPEDTIILDFWAKVTGAPSTVKGKTISATIKRPPIKSTPIRPKKIKRDLDSSDLTELSSDESDPEAWGGHDAVSRTLADPALQKPLPLNEREGSTESSSSHDSAPYIPPKSVQTQVKSKSRTGSNHAVKEPGLVTATGLDSAMPETGEIGQTNPRKRKAPPRNLNKASLGTGVRKTRAQSSTLEDLPPMTAFSTTSQVFGSTQSAVPAMQTTGVNGQNHHTGSPSMLTSTFNSMSANSPHLDSQLPQTASSHSVNQIGPSDSAVAPDTPKLSSSVGNSPLKIRLALPLMKKRKTEGASSSSSAENSVAGDAIGNAMEVDQKDAASTAMSAKSSTSSASHQQADFVVEPPLTTNIKGGVLV